MSQEVNYSYEITSRPDHLGGGWRLRLLENNEEVGGGVFPPQTDAFANPTDALQAAYFDAESEAYCWLDRCPGHMMDHDYQRHGLFADPVQGENSEGDSAIAADRHRRQAAVDFAMANVGLVGFTPSEEVQDRMRRFIDGEIDLDEFVKGVMDHAKREV
jgi:hypothetical protein